MWVTYCQKKTISSHAEMLIDLAVISILGVLKVDFFKRF